MEPATNPLTALAGRVIGARDVTMAGKTRYHTVLHDARSSLGAICINQDGSTVTIFHLYKSRRYILTVKPSGEVEVQDRTAIRASDAGFSNNIIVDTPSMTHDRVYATTTRHADKELLDRIESAIRGITGARSDSCNRLLALIDRAPPEAKLAAK